MLNKAINSLLVMVIEKTSENLLEPLVQRDSSNLLLFNSKTQSPGKVLELLSHQSHQFQDLSVLPPPLLEMLTRKVLMVKLLSLMPKNPSNSLTIELLKPKPDFHMPQLFFNFKLRIQFPGKVKELPSHQLHQSQDSLLLPLLLLLTPTRRVLMAKSQLSMPKNLSNSLTIELPRPKLDSHTPLP